MYLYSYIGITLDSWDSLCAKYLKLTYKNIRNLGREQSKDVNSKFKVQINNDNNSTIYSIVI